MKRQKRIIKGFAGLFLWFWIGVGMAEAAVIAHLNANNLPVLDPGTNAPVLPTITILDAGGKDITGTWLPEPGETVTIQVNGALVTSLTLDTSPGGTTASPWSQ